MKLRNEKSVNEISRRDFIKVTAATGAGVLFSRNVIAKASEKFYSKKNTR